MPESTAVYLPLLRAADAIASILNGSTSADMEIVEEIAGSSGEAAGTSTPVAPGTAGDAFGGHNTDGSTAAEGPSSSSDSGSHKSMDADDLDVQNEVCLDRSDSSNSTEMVTEARGPAS